MLVTPENMKTPAEEMGSWPSLRSFEGPPYPEESAPQVATTEEERAALIHKDAKNKYLLESHLPPIVWARHQQGFRIQDMYAQQFEDVNHLIMKHMPSDPLLKTIKDPEAVGLYLSTLMTWYPKTQSLVALKEGSKEVIGVLIGRLVMEDKWFELLSEIPFVAKKDKYAYLKPRTSSPIKGAAKGGKRESKRQSKAGGSRKSMGAKGGSRKSMGAKGGSRKSMGAKGGSRKSMGAKGGSRKSMGAKGGGQRKSMGAKGGGQRKSMGAQRKSMGAKGGGQRKSMGAKGGGQRKSMGAKGGSRKSMGGGSRKSMTGKSGKGGKHRRGTEQKKGDTKVPRPIDIIPEEVIPVVQAVVFDDDNVTFAHKELQYMQMFKKKLADRFRIWKLMKQKMYYRVYLVAVSPKYERLEIDRALFVSLKHMCLAFNIQAIAGVLTTYSSQNAFYDIGGLIVYEILYKHYPRFESSDPKSYDKSAAVMFLELPSEIPRTSESPPGSTSLGGAKPKGK